MPENTPSTGYVGGPILATDDGTAELSYEIGGANASRFYIAELTASYETDALYYNGAADDTSPVMDDDRDSGPAQIAVAPVTHLDADDDDNNTYMVEITATDSEGQRATAMVTIMVTDVNEAPSAPRGFSASARPMPQNTAPDFGATSTALSVDENAAADTVVGTVTATDTDRPAQTLTYSLDDGADAGSFSIDSAGEITTSAMLDYETQDSYMVTVTATDDGDPAKSATIMVTISVMDVMLGEPGDTYDADSNEMISRSEVIEAIRDFLFAQTITKEQVIDVIRLYLSR